MKTSNSNRRSRTPLQRVAGGALASLVALGAIAIGVDATATPATFPALNQWVVVTLGNTPVFDPEGDTPGARDIVGDATFPMLYIASDATHIYFRLRVDSDPLQNATNFGPFGWGCFVDTDDDPQTYEYSTLIDGVANPDRIYLYKNTVTTTLNDPNDPPDQPPLEDLQAPLTVAVGHARSVPAGDPTFGGSNSNFGGNGDFFIDWAFERSAAEAAGFNTTQTARYYCGSANNGETIAADCSGSAASSCPLDSQFSDPITCGPGGCAICGNGVTTGGEGCDDGNLVDGDGCSSSCLIELGEPCTTSPGCESGFCDPAGNICACDTDADCPSGDVCNTLANPNECVECVSDAQCLDPAAPACDVLTNTCVECVLDSDCAGNLVCEPATNTCVQCLDDGDCPGGVCNTSTNTCTGCLDDGDCPTGSVCETTLQVCVACLDDGDCTTDPALPACKTDANPTLNACVECVANGDCATNPGGPVCESTTNTCVGCLQDSDCTTGVCDTTAKLCVECLGNGDCTAPTPACKVDAADSTNNTCVECTLDGDCGMGFVCNQALNQCVQCTNDGQCLALDPNEPTCNLASSTCVVCLDDGDCSVNFPTTPTCKVDAGNADNNACVECVDDGDCLSGVCNTTSNTCVECVQNSDCTSGVCNTANNTCVECLDDTQCVGDPEGPACDTTINVCVACLANDDCSAPTPLCKTTSPSTSNVCVECLDNSVCTGNETCDLSTNTCEPPCTVDADCQNGFVCDPGTNSCVECADDGDCDGGEVCDTTAKVCVACLDDGDCSAPTPACKVDAGNSDNNACVECVDDGDCTAGVCDTTSNTCVGCVDDGDCTSGVCDEDAQICVECLVNADCPTEEPVCKVANDSVNNECVECVADSDCESNACDTATNTCEEPEPTGCDTDADCIVGQVCDTAARACVPGCRVDGTGNGCPEGELCVEVAAGNPVGVCEPAPEEEDVGFSLEGGGCSCRAAGSEEPGSRGGLGLALFGLAMGGALARRRQRRA